MHILFQPDATFHLIFLFLWRIGSQAILPKSSQSMKKVSASCSPMYLFLISTIYVIQ